MTAHFQMLKKKIDETFYNIPMVNHNNKINSQNDEISVDHLTHNHNVCISYIWLFDSNNFDF